MLGFILSMIAFFVAVYFLNGYLDHLDITKSFYRRFFVGLAATMLSIGAGWATDNIDGDSNSAQKKCSLSDI